MARPRKQTVDYFPHYCTHKKTMFILEQRYGNDGYAFWFKLLEMLGQAEGHYLDLTESATWEFLQSQTRLSNGSCDEILNLLARLDAIDAELWGQKLVWCQNFVDGISLVYRNRRVEIPTREAIYSKKPAIAQLPTRRKPQSKVKESRVKESILDTNTLFSTFWDAYPKKKSKGQAERAFAKLNPDDDLLATMLVALKQAKKSEDWLKEEGKYIPYPATWLNAKGWEDEYKEAKNGSYRGNPSQKPSGAFDGLE